MSKKSLKEKLRARREELAKGGGNFNFFIFKEGITRLRHVPVGEDTEPALEVFYVFISKEEGGLISPSTFGDRCAFKEAYDELRNSKDEKDKKFAGKVQPKRKFVSLAYRYKDELGKTIDVENGVKLALLSKSQYEDMLDLFLDDESGDFTDKLEGYDLKHKRTGSGQLDTKYKVLACKPSKCAKEYRGPYNLEEEVKKMIPTYKETKVLLEKLLNIADGDDDDDEKPTKKTSSKKKKRDI